MKHADELQDSLADGRTVPILSVIDEYSRECVMVRVEKFPIAAGARLS